MTDTTNQFFNRPLVGGAEDVWGDRLNENWAKLDALLQGTSYTDADGNTVERIQPDLETGWAVNGTAITATAVELNQLSGLTATTAELNILDGVTATTAELNYVDGVTSNIQTQLNAKQASDATLTALAGLATGANKVPYSTGTDTFGQLDFLDQDNMASNSATAIPSQQSVKAYVDGFPSILAWVNFNGTGTVAIRASYNVTSITDDGTGDYTITFTNALPNANYVVTGTATESGVRTGRTISAETRSTTSVQVKTSNAAVGGAVDCDFVEIAIIG